MAFLMKYRYDMIKLLKFIEYQLCPKHFDYIFRLQLNNKPVRSLTVSPPLKLKDMRALQVIYSKSYSQQ